MLIDPFADIVADRKADDDKYGAPKTQGYKENAGDQPQDNPYGFAAVLLP